MASEAARLRTLAQVSIDSVKGYEAAAEAAKSPELKQTLRECAVRRQQVVDRLNAEIARLGGERQTSGSAAGAAHRAWTQVSDAFGSGDETATDRIEEGEEYLEEQFRKALEDGDFSPETREIVRQCHAEIKEDARRAEQLEDQYD